MLKTAPEKAPRSTRARISVDVTPEERRRLKLVAAWRSVSVRHYVTEALEQRLAQDSTKMSRETGARALRGADDPVLSDLWDNPLDAEYDRL